MNEVQEVRASFNAGQFNVAVVGQFKRGKSTMINALIGRELLPADIVPVTSAITVLQYAPDERCRVLFSNGQEEEIHLEKLGIYVSEEENPGNQKNVHIILLELPAPILSNGLRLVDTPGVGSVFELNSETTRAFMPRIDVALVVLGNDPPITGEELELVKSLKGRAERYIFAINKCDIASEKVRNKSEEFTRKVLRKELGEEPQFLIHCSAFNALHGKPDEGIKSLSVLLGDTAARAGENLARQSAISSSKHLASRLIQQIELEKEGLVRPLSRLDENIAQFQTATRDLGDLMLGAKVRIEKEGSFDFNEWTAQKEKFIAEKSKAIINHINDELKNTNIPKTAIKNFVLEKAREKSADCVKEWSSLAQSRFDKFYAARFLAATHELNRLTSRISAAASEAFGISLTSFELPKISLILDKAPFEFSQQTMALDLSDFIVPITNVILPKSRVVKINLRHARKLIEEWLQKNLYVVDEHLINWLDTATRSLANVVSRRLADLEQEILSAVEKGRNERNIGEKKVAERLSLLENQHSALSAIIDEAKY